MNKSTIPDGLPASASDPKPVLTVPSMRERLRDVPADAHGLPLNDDGYILPQHVAIIMDGNGRWARQHGLSRAEGHQAGVESIHRVIKVASQYGIKQLTLFGFSSENWRRPGLEIKSLFDLFYKTLREFLPKLEHENVKIQFIGDLTQFPKKLQNYLQHAQAVTAENTGLLIVVALNYGGRWDILQAVQKIVTEVQQSDFVARTNDDGCYEISEEKFKTYLSTSLFLEPDLLIRTSGEQRISNFLLWQLAYTELYFTQVLWPDFDESTFHDALDFYQSRQRRFGGLDDK